MAASLGLSLRASQSLALTPQLQQSIRMLQLSAQELSQEIQQMLEQNPCLLEAQDEEDGLDDGFAEPAYEPQRDFDGGHVSDSAEQGILPEDAATEGPSEPDDWEGDGSVAAEDLTDHWADANPGATHPEPGDDRGNDFKGVGASLQQHLLQQVHHLRLNELERAALLLLIDALDDDGFIAESHDELAEVLRAACAQAGGLGVHIEVQEEALASAVRIASCALQQLDPIGVGARNSMHALAIQAQHQLRLAQIAGNFDSASSWVDVIEVFKAPLQWIALRDAPKIARHCGVSVARVELALGMLRSLSPKPASAFGADAASAVVPEVFVRRSGSSFRVELNPRSRHALRVDIGLAQHLRASGRDHPLAQKLQEARWFVKNLQQRYDTILRVSQVIVDRQRRFFLHGATAMRPLVLREVADELGVHESTVSRVTTAKYLQGPTGTFELKYFFASALETTSGSSTSATAVKAILRELIAQENAQLPLSDTALAQALEGRGILCARRTVAKYREALHIPVAQLRKTTIS